MKVIPTQYRGYRFRSRLEARWGKFFDALALPWVYEPEGFELENGLRYLPDFWLPNHDCWFEVKGEAPTEEEKQKALGLASGTGKAVYLFYGPVGPLELPISGGLCAYPNGDLDGLISWADCPYCGKVGLGEFGYQKGHVPNSGHNSGLLDSVDPMFTPRLKQAYIAARSARFEHGDRKLGL